MLSRFYFRRFDKSKKRMSRNFKIQIIETTPLDNLMVSFGDLDINGKMIFEGDFVKKDDFVFLVHLSNKYAKMNCKGLIAYIGDYDIKAMMPEYPIWEIVGNIFEDDCILKDQEEISNRISELDSGNGYCINKEIYEVIKQIKGEVNE